MSSNLGRIGLFTLELFTLATLYTVTTTVKKNFKGGVRVNSLCIRRMKPMAKTSAMIAKSFKWVGCV